jgi:DNA replication protein DnaC
MAAMAKTPPRIDTTTWRDRIPEGTEPVEVPDSHTETPEQARERIALQHANRVKAYRESVPVMYREAALADLDEQTQGLVQDWLTRQGSTLMLAGPVGTGKTHAAYAVLNDAAETATVAATTLADLLAALRPDGDARAAQRARTADLLLLDDFGAAKASEWAVEQVVALLDARLREGRRQVVTTNAPYDALVEAWDDRAMDRLRYRWTVIQMTGESRRKAAW